MLAFIKRNIFVLIIFIITLILGFVTFLTFIDKSFISLTEKNLNYLLITNILLLIFFFTVIFIETKNSLQQNINVRGSISNRKYILFFSLFTLIPSILISIFSLFLFSFALEKYFDNKITTAVNNSYEIAKKYVSEKRNKVETDIILVAYDIDKNENFLKNKKNFQNFINNQRILRNLDQIHIINNKKEIILSSSKTGYLPVEDKALKMVLNENRPLKIINAFENKSAAIIKLPKYNNTFLYVVKFLDEDISKYLRESEEALNFYYTVDDKNLGIKISFALIYIITVALLLFLSITIAIKFSSRFFISINNLISASNEIGNGNLNIKVPNIKADKEIELLNKNFNAMITRLRYQQDKLLINERHEAWDSVARKLAHEIKNPLTPIQLSIDSLRDKYKSKLTSDSQQFEKYLETINRQIKDIEKLVNEFSNFARMPRPILKKVNIKNLINQSLDFVKISSKNKINFTIKTKYHFILGDEDQLNRVFMNLIKNSEESFLEKFKKDPNFKGNIDIEISDNNEYIVCRIIDNGPGITDTKKVMTPYFTTKKTGTGLGLPIVNKIINEHSGNFLIKNKSKGEGILIKILLPKFNA